jgi:CIC family chloride channel protein
MKTWPNSGSMGWRVAWVKLLASGLAIGSGLPVGPEGPAIQIGASVARETADAFGGGDRRVAVAIGSGAGLAAVFHAPLGGLLERRSFFEVLLEEARSA